MGTYRIVGGAPLYGSVPIHGAKNSVLPILAATLVTGDTCELHNCPQISDVDDALEILRCLGCETEQCGATIRVDTAAATPTELPAALMKRMRAAIIFLGAMLTRFSHAALYHPGGCPLGERPIDLHLRGLQRRCGRTNLLLLEGADQHLIGALPVACLAVSERRRDGEPAAGGAGLQGRGRDLQRRKRA